MAGRTSQTTTASMASSTNKEASDDSYGCSNCSSILKENDQAMFCDLCQGWFCLKCTKLTSKLYDMLNTQSDLLGCFMWSSSDCKRALPDIKNILTTTAMMERENHGKKVQLLNSSDKLDGKFSVTLKDYGPQHEKTETLKEYISAKKSPWRLDYSWSNEAKALREIAVRSPWLIDDNFIRNYFKTLRICDKNVEEVDERLLQFTNLEELTLSANQIVTINSKNLPAGLKVLELCANRVSDISGLCARPPPLLHLGLGYNRVSFIGDYITADYWPMLLSLDLSHNNLSDLLDVVRKLGTLPNLRNVVLQGNPLSLIPGYRGYTVDSLRKLNVFDDIRITADERHHFKGLARRREFILDEAKVLLEVSYLKGLPMPDEIKYPEDQPEYPIVERKYFVQFMFLEDSSSKAEVFHIDYARSQLSPLLDSEAPPSMAADIDSNFASANEESMPVSAGQGDVPKTVLFAAEAEIVPSLDKDPTASDAHMMGVEGVTPSDQLGSPEDEEGADAPRVSVSPIKTVLFHWAEELEFNWSTHVIRDDLVSLRDFFQQGMELAIVEEKVLATPAESSAVCDQPSPSGSTGKKAGAKEEKAGKADKKKDDKGKDAKGGKGDKEGKKKKKGEPEEELVRSPPEYTTLATFTLPLAELLEGEFVLEAQFTKSMGDGEIDDETGKTDDMKKDDKKDAKKKVDSPKKKEEVKGKDKGKVEKKDAKGKGKGSDKNGSSPDNESEAPPPPPPIELHVAVRLHHWETAYDSLKEEEEKTKLSAELSPAEEAS